MFCVECGKEVQEDWKICPFCGSEVVKKASVQMKEEKPDVSDAERDSAIGSMIEVPESEKRMEETEEQDAEQVAKTYEYEGVRIDGRYWTREISTIVKVEGEKVSVFDERKQREYIFQKSDIVDMQCVFRPLWWFTDFIRIIVFSAFMYVSNGLAIFAVLWSIGMACSEQLIIELQDGRRIIIPIRQKGEVLELLEDLKAPIEVVAKCRGEVISTRTWNVKHYLIKCLMVAIVIFTFYFGYGMYREGIEWKDIIKAGNPIETFKEILDYGNWDTSESSARGDETIGDSNQTDNTLESNEISTPGNLQGNTEEVIQTENFAGYYEDSEDGMYMLIYQKADRVSFLCINADDTLFAQAYNCPIREHESVGTYIDGTYWFVGKNSDGTLNMSSGAGGAWGHFARIGELDAFDRQMMEKTAEAYAYVENREFHKIGYETTMCFTTSKDFYVPVDVYQDYSEYAFAPDYDEYSNVVNICMFIDGEEYYFYYTQNGGFILNGAGFWAGSYEEVYY